MAWTWSVLKQELIYYIDVSNRFMGWFVHFPYGNIDICWNKMGGFSLTDLKFRGSRRWPRIGKEKQPENQTDR